MFTMLRQLFTSLLAFSGFIALSLGDGRHFSPQNQTHAHALTITLTPAVPWERLDKNDALLVILDLQDGLYGVARDFDPTVYHHAMLAHAAVGMVRKADERVFWCYLRHVLILLPVTV